MSVAGSKGVRNVRRTIIGALVLLAVAAWVFGLHLGSTTNELSQIGITNRPVVIEASDGPATPVSTTSQPQATDTPSAVSDSGQQPVLPPTPTATRRAAPSPTATTVVTREPMATDLVLPTPTPFVPASLGLTPPPTERFVLVDQDDQVMIVYEDGIRIRTIPVSTGAPVANAFTPPWSGRIGPFWGKAAFRGTNLWADYIWYLFPGTEGSILIHSVPYTRNGDEKVYDRLDALGVEPASRGCIRISPEDAEWLARWGPVGVPIEITAWSGVIGPADDSL